MKRIVLVLLFATCYSHYSKAQNKILFTYDTAGNQIVRQLCINCLTSKKAKTEEEILASKEEEKEKFTPEDTFSFYPNPVKEELYLFWTPSTTGTPTSLQVYSISGQLLYSSAAILHNSSYHVVPFQNYPSGMYLVQLHYPAGTPKSIKIIKK